MEISLNVVILRPAHFPKLNTTNRKSVKSPLLHCCCLRKNEEAAAYGLFKAPSSKLEVASNDNVDMYQEKFSPSNFESEAKDNDIWKLFKEAQQNILYLNKQRLLAVEELSKANREKELLLDKIEQLEAEKQAADVGKDKQFVCCELLLRIDSMVLMGMITASEASNLRNAVMDYKFSVADRLFDNEQKSDAELLAELRHFSHGSKNPTVWSLCMQETVS